MLEGGMMMVSKRLEAERDNVVGLVPIYSDMGNATEIWLNTGEVFVDKRGIKSVRRNFARTYAIDLVAQRFIIEEYLQRKGPLPFYIGKRVFMQLKMRQPVTENDMVYGFWDVGYVKTIEPLEKGARCEAVMPDGKRVKILSHYSTALAAREMGERLAVGLLQVSRESSEEDNVVRSVLAFIGSLKEISYRLERMEGRIAESGGGYSVK